jgi:hypothetical protein
MFVGEIILGDAFVARGVQLEQAGVIPDSLLSVWYRVTPCVRLEKHEHHKLIRDVFFSSGERKPVGTKVFSTGR